MPLPPAAAMIPLLQRNDCFSYNLSPSQIPKYLFILTTPERPGKERSSFPGLLRWPDSFIKSDHHMPGKGHGA